MASRVPGLYAAGEAAGGANGANRLSGNAIPEALVFGERAGRFAADMRRPQANEFPLALSRGRGGRADPGARRGPRRCEIAAAGCSIELRDIMWRDVGPFRDAAGLDAAPSRGSERCARHCRNWRSRRAGVPIRRLPTGSSCAPASSRPRRLHVRGAGATARAAARTSASDFPDTDPAWARNQRVTMTPDGAVAVDDRDDGARPLALRIRRGTGDGCGRATRSSRCRSKTARRVLDALIWIRGTARSVAGDPLQLHQRQCLQGMHDRDRWRGRLRLHDAAGRRSR